MTQKTLNNTAKTQEPSHARWCKIQHSTQNAITRFRTPLTNTSTLVFIQAHDMRTITLERSIHT